MGGPTIDKAIAADATAFSMMARWKAGSWSSGSLTSKATDFSMNLSTWQGKSLTMADYIWTAYLNSSTQICKTCNVTSWKDSGW